MLSKLHSTETHQHGFSDPNKAILLDVHTEIIHNVISLGAMKIFRLIENKAQLFSLFKRKVQIFQ